jgi:hypothetical protein
MQIRRRTAISEYSPVPPIALNISLIHGLIEEEGRGLLDAPLGIGRTSLSKESAA